MLAVPTRENQGRRSNKPDLAEEVLARWPDDGWFYFGSIKEKVSYEDHVYKVKDSTGYVAHIHVNDILRHQIDFTQCFQVNNNLQRGSCC